MDKKRFFYCTNEASKILSNSEINYPTITLSDLRHGHRIIADTIQNFCTISGIDYEKLSNSTKFATRDGLLVIRNGVNIILYNNKIPNYYRINWTILHEFGHIYLGHMQDSDTEEKETNTFVAQLLMPIYSIIQIKKYIGYIDEYIIENIFNVSSLAANIRINELQNMVTENYIPSDYDLAIWKNTKSYIIHELVVNPNIKTPYNNRKWLIYT